MAQGAVNQELPQLFHTMGQPPRWKPYLGAFAGINNITTTDTPTSVGGLGLIGLYRDLINPLVGVGFAAEAYAGSISQQLDGGARLNVAFPVVFLQGGVDYSISDHSFAFILSFALPIRRGGILGLGSLARVDWLPARGQTVNVGLQIPVLQPWVGKTRPKAQDITIPRAPHAQFERSDSIAQADTTEPAAAALAQMRREAVWYINLINVFYTGLGKSYDDAIQTQRDTIATFIKAAGQRDALHPQGWSPSNEMGLWHAQMKIAFAVAAGTLDPAAGARGAQAPGASGSEIARAARRALLDSVLIPYDARFGQYKDPNQITGYGSRGRLAFEAWVAVSDIAPDRHAAVIAVFDGIIGILEQCRKELYRVNGTDSRLNWMPMQFALEADEHDDQEEIDRLIERVVDRPFTPANAAVFMSGPAVPGRARQPDRLGAFLSGALDSRVSWHHRGSARPRRRVPDAQLPAGAAPRGRAL